MSHLLKSITLWSLASLTQIPVAMGQAELGIGGGDDNPVYFKQNRNSLLLPYEKTAETLLESQNKQNAQPFGANLFAGGYESERIDGVNENYLIAPGDKLNIWIWGAVDFAEVLTVDNQGNIFIPNIGPINIGGRQAGSINTYVTREITKVYQKNINVYVNLLSATPISIYLTGAVMRPGQYAGMASDSLLYFLKRGGGVDNARGSYRNIALLRNGKQIKQFDLYEFIREGKIDRNHFMDGDVLLVKPVGKRVHVFGAANYPFSFELPGESISGQAFLELAKPETGVSHVGLTGDRPAGPFTKYLSLEEFGRFELHDGDRVTFNDDKRAQMIDVSVAGSYLGQSFYSMSKNTRLRDLLAHIEVDGSLADYKSVYIYRKSVAQRQKEAIEQSLNRLERSIFTSPASSTGEAQIRTQEAALVMQFVEKAKAVQPLGKVIVSDGNTVADIRLEQGDQVVIPARTDLVMVSGEVLIPQAVYFNEGLTVDDYIKLAGGFTERANNAEIAILHANGVIDFAYSGPIVAGDQVMVMPKIDTKNMQFVKDITQVLYQIAIAANVVQNI